MLPTLQLCLRVQELSWERSAGSAVLCTCGVGYYFVWYRVVLSILLPRISWVLEKKASIVTIHRFAHFRSSRLLVCHLGQEVLFLSPVVFVSLFLSCFCLCPHHSPSLIHSPAKNQRPEPVVGSSWELALTLWAFLSSSPADVDALLDESVVKVFK